VFEGNFGPMSKGTLDRFLGELQTDF
jgi:hypothetical protein